MSLNHTRCRINFFALYVPFRPCSHTRYPFIPVPTPGTKDPSLWSRTDSPGSKTGTKGPKEPGQKTDSVLVIVTFIFNFDYYVFEN